MDMDCARQVRTAQICLEIQINNSNPPPLSGLGTGKSDQKGTLWQSYLGFYLILYIYIF